MSETPQFMRDSIRDAIESHLAARGGGFLQVRILRRRLGDHLMQKLSKDRIDLQRVVLRENPDNPLRRQSVEFSRFFHGEKGHNSLSRIAAQNLENSHEAIVT